MISMELTDYNETPFECRVTGGHSTFLHSNSLWISRSGWM